MSCKGHSSLSGIPVLDYYSFTQMEEALLNNDSKQHWIISLWTSTRSIITLTVFCIGAATSAKQANIPDTYIKMLGCWRSDTYQLGLGDNE